MDSDLKSEFAEHQSLQDVIIKKIRDSIKKQEARENPFKLLRCMKYNDYDYGAGYIYLNPNLWISVDISPDSIVYSHTTYSYTIKKNDQKDDDYQKIVDYITQRSVNISELVNNWDKYLDRLSELFIHISTNKYFRLSHVNSILIQEGLIYYSIIMDRRVRYLNFRLDDPVVQDLKKLFELLTQ